MTCFFDLHPSILIARINFCSSLTQATLCDTNESYESDVRIIVWKIIDFILSDKVKNNHAKAQCDCKVYDKVFDPPANFW